jgi:HSP20 family protein
MEDSGMVDLATLGPAHVDDVCELVISADLPGVDENDVEVTLSGDTLTIRGEKKVEHEEVTDEGRYRERRVQVLSRSIRLPFEVKDGDIDADFDDGVLTVCVHKPPEAMSVQKPPEVQETVRRIEVKRTQVNGTREGEVEGG